MRRIVLFLVMLMALSALGPLGVGAAPPRQGGIHVVQPGENLSTIALRYGTTTVALMRANGIVNPNWIYAGQRLTIPTASGGYHTVRRGENLSTIAARYGVSVGALIRANGLYNPNTIYVGQRLRIPQRDTAAGGTHVVQWGETLASIALRYGVTIGDLVRANGLYSPNLVYAGQRLSIPSGGTSTAPASPAPVTSKLIEIDLSRQRMTVWENGWVKWRWVCSTGEPGRSTIPGHFKVLNKIPNAYSSLYHLQMPWWLGIYWAGNVQNGIHALPILPNGQRLWDGLLGRRVSYGCIILDADNARTLYYWADIGTPVNIHW